MKYGVIWFLHLDTPIQCARLGVLLFLALGFVLTIGSLLFILSWLLFAVCLIVTVCTFFMHIPSSQKVERFVSEYEIEFLERVKAEFRNERNVGIKTLRCFAADKKRGLSRWVGSKKFYGTLVMLARVQTKDSCWLIRDEKSLCRDLPNTLTRYKMERFEDLEIQKEATDADGEVRWSLRFADVCFHCACKDDYHLRDFCA